MNTALLTIILVPIIEIYLFIKIGNQIGAFNTISLIFITAIIGVVYARYEGLNTLRSGFSQLIKNELLNIIKINMSECFLKRLSRRSSLQKRISKIVDFSSCRKWQRRTTVLLRQKSNLQLIKQDYIFVHSILLGILHFTRFCSLYTEPTSVTDRWKDC